MNTDNKVLHLHKEDVPEIVSVLCDAFENYPVMRFVLGPGNNYNNRLNILINFFVMARIYRQENIFGIGDSTALKGVALTSFPGNKLTINEFSKFRESIWQQLGYESRTRYQQFVKTCAQFDIDVPHIHLNMIGIKQNAQGMGYANKLMEQVNLLSLSDSDSKGISLTTEDPEKVSLYKYMGYNLTGEAMVSEQLKTWSFFKQH